MTTPSLVPPSRDPAPLFELFRGNHATELLTAAVAHFNLFRQFPSQKSSLSQLREQLGLAERPVMVLLTALCAFGLLRREEQGNYSMTDLARDHLTPGSPFDISGYIGLAAETPGVLAMVERLRTNRPAGTEPTEQGAAFIYREGLESAMEKETAARQLTLALAGRAFNVAPVLAERYPLADSKILLDVGGGTGIYSIAWLQRHPHLRAIVWDRPEVLKVAQELADAHCVSSRLECRPGDMFRDPVPACDTVLLSNVLHDWDATECRTLIQRLATALPTKGQLLIHDVFLNDTLDGPLPIALYSAALFSLTEGRAYSAAEYADWLREAGLRVGNVVSTLIHCGVLPAFQT